MMNIIVQWLKRLATQGNTGPNPVDGIIDIKLEYSSRGPGHYPVTIGTPIQIRYIPW